MKPHPKLPRLYEARNQNSRKFVKFLSPLFPSFASVKKSMFIRPALQDPWSKIRVRLRQALSSSVKPKKPPGGCSTHFAAFFDRAGRLAPSLTGCAPTFTVWELQGSQPARFARRLRVLRGSAADPLNLIQVMLAKGWSFNPFPEFPYRSKRKANHERDQR